MQELVLDIETTMIETNRKEDLEIVAVGLKYVGEEGVIYDWNNLKERRYVKKLLGKFEGVIIGHNLMFDVGVLRVNKCPMPNVKFYDTMIALKCINIEESRFSLKTWATYLGYPPYWKDFEEALGIIPVNKMPWELVEKYNKIDLEVTEDLYAYTKELLGESGNEQAFDLEMDILPLAERMETGGIQVDFDALSDHSEGLFKKIEKIEDGIIEEYGPINLNSPFQVAKLLYDDIGVPQVDGYGRSTAEAVLKKIRHKVAKKLLERRKLNKLITSFITPIQDLSLDGYLYADVRLHGTESGRFSMKKPPLQTIPEDLRNVFVPSHGAFVYVDLDQLEFKLMADLAGEESMIKEIRAGRDVHEAAASRMFGSKDITPEQRSIAKTINYAKMYGAGLRTIVEGSGLSWYKAKEFSNAFEMNLPVTMAFISWVHKTVTTTNAIETPFGRRREFLVDFSVAHEKVRYAVQRQAVDFIIQSMGHDLLSLLWLEIVRRLPGIDCRLELHDELVFDVDPQEVSFVTEEIQKALDILPKLCYDRFRYELEVPITGTIKTGGAWK